MSYTDEFEILLVEDNPGDVDMTLRALRKANLGKSVQIARDGAEALAFLFGENTPSARQVPNVPRLILLDLKLPKIDGFGVLQRVKSDPRTRQIPIVILTSSKEPRDVFEGYDLGVNSYIVKPMNFEGFVEAVEKLGVYWLMLNQPPN